MGSDSKSNGGAQITGAEKKLVQSLREIVNNNCTDSEIYAVLKECGMDPNDAVQRLLSQDTFHEVKSKRERRKEMKETQESRARGNNGASNRGGRVGSEHTIVRSGSMQSSSSELGKAAYRRENGLLAPLPYTSSIYHAPWKTSNDHPSPHSDCFDGYNSGQSIGTGDTISSSVQPSPGFQPTWSMASSGHVSMADIVRLGGPHNKGSQMLTVSSHMPHDTDVLNSSQYCTKSPNVLAPPQPEMHQDLHSPHPSCVSEVTSGQHYFDNGWPVIEQIPAAAALSTSAASDSKICSNESHIYGDRANLSRNFQSDEVQASERDGVGENLNSDSVGSASASSRQVMVIGTEEASNGNDNLLKDKNFYQEGHSSPFSDDINIAVSSAAVSLQQLNLEKDESSVHPAEDNRAVVLPNYLHDLAADCSHLSFGTYKSSNGSAFSGLLESSTLREDLEEVPSRKNGSSAVHLDTRYLGYHTDEELGFMYDIHRKAANAKNHDLHIPAEAELMNRNIPEATHGQEHLSSSILDSSFKNIEQLNSPMSFSIDPNARNLPPLPSELHSYSNSIPYDLLESTVQSLRARDSLPFLGTQTMPSRYSSALSSISSPTISMSEVLSSGAFSLPQPFSQVLPGANHATEPVLPQHLSAHSYSEIGYPAMHQSYPYMPSAAQQAYPDSNTFHESLAGIRYNLSQYRSGGSMNNLPLSNPNASGHASLGSSTDIPGRFLYNISTAPTGAKVEYDDVLRSQYKDGNDFTLHENDSSATWNYGPGSRTMSTVPDSVYYSLLGQNQQHSGYRQSQRPSQSYGGLGYPNFYNAEVGITREQQHQNLSDASLSGSQGPSSKQLQQIWQPSY